MPEVSQKVGFIGLGVMGLPMAQNLARSRDLEIHAFDLSDKPFAVLERHEAWQQSLFRAETIAALGQCQNVITMLPNSKITSEVIEGAGNLLDSLAPGATIIDMGSSDPAETRRLQSLAVQRQIALIDAPVSGALAKARSGELAIMVGTDAHTLEALKPLLSGMGRQIIATGQVGSAHAIKALNNYVYAAGLLAVSEAVAIAQKLGIDVEILAEVLNASSGRNVASETKLRQFILSGHYSGGFALRLQAKDLATAASLQNLSEFDAPQLQLCAELWSKAAAVLDPGADNTEIHKFLLQRPVLHAAE